MSIVKPRMIWQSKYFKPIHIPILQLPTCWRLLFQLATNVIVMCMFSTNSWQHILWTSGIGRPTAGRDHSNAISTSLGSIKQERVFKARPLTRAKCQYEISHGTHELNLQRSPAARPFVHMSVYVDRMNCDNVGEREWERIV